MYTKMIQILDEARKRMELLVRLRLWPTWLLPLVGIVLIESLLPGGTLIAAILLKNRGVFRH